MPILFIAAAEAMARWRGRRARGRRGGGRSAAAGELLDVDPDQPRRRHGAAMMAAITVALAFQFPLSDLWHGSTYQIEPARRRRRTRRWRWSPTARPCRPTLDLLAPLAARTDTFWIGNPGNPLTQYIVFDGQDSGYSPRPSPTSPRSSRCCTRTTATSRSSSGDDVYVFRRS